MAIHYPHGHVVLETCGNTTATPFQSRRKNPWACGKRGPNTTRLTRSFVWCGPNRPSLHFFQKNDHGFFQKNKVKKWPMDQANKTKKVDHEKPDTTNCNILPRPACKHQPSACQAICHNNNNNREQSTENRRKNKNRKKNKKTTYNASTPRRYPDRV